MDRIQEHLEEFYVHLLENGYSPTASKNYRFRASTFLRLCPEALEAGESEAREIVEGYIAELPRNTASTIPAAAVRRWWAFRFRKPCRDRIVPSALEASEAIKAELAEFEGYLAAHGNVRAETIRDRVASVKLFLCATFPDGTFERRAITPKDVVDYHTAAATAEGATMRALQGSDLRSYIRFLRRNGIDDIPLDAVSLCGPARRSRTVPGRLSEEEYEALLASCDTGTERGARDVAMALCMGNLGMRACDVARLTLDDVAWAAGTITVRDSKSKTARTLPLDERTGAAIGRHVLMRGRCDNTRSLFLNTAGSPIRSCRVQTAMSLAAGRAGIEAYHGTHGLRRTVATNMANAGVDAKTIADVLGHERVDTTMGYVKVSLPNLRLTHLPTVERSRSYPGIISQSGLPLSHGWTTCRLKPSPDFLGCFGSAMTGLLVSLFPCLSSLQTVPSTIAIPHRCQVWQGRRAGGAALPHGRGRRRYPQVQQAARMAQNFDVFDFELSEDDREQIRGLDAGKSIILDHHNLDTVQFLLDRIKGQIDAAK